MPEKYRVRKEHHLKDYDYTTPGAYFITICTKARNQNILSELLPVGAADPGGLQVRLTPLGRIVDELIRGIPSSYPGVTVDQYIIMPDHIHLLLFLTTGNGPPGSAAPTGVPTIVNALKGLATRRHGATFWQDDYYDHVIRDDRDLCETRLYL